jgi:hypothetical protein
MPLPRPKHLFNPRVRLSPEAAGAGERRALEWSDAVAVHWVQCYRCRRRYWYSLLAETPDAERFYYGSLLREYLLGQPCEGHPAAAGIEIIGV